jgi:hypothetical protein
MPDTTKTPTRVGIEFAALLMQQDKGRLHDDATDRVREVVAAVASTGGKGKVTLTFEIEPLDPATFADTTAVAVRGKVESTVPRPARAVATYFTKRTGELTRDDPNAEDPRGA